MSSSRSHSVEKSGRSSGPSLRRSCHFCRTRKIRCSGDSNGICAACRARGGDCIFNAESTKGRPKRTASASTTLSTQHNPSIKLPAKLRHHHSDPTPDRSTVTPGTIGEDLSFLCGTNETASDDLRLDPWKHSMTALREKVEQSHHWLSDQTIMNMDVESGSNAGIQHQGLLGLIAQDLVCMMATQLGRFRCEGNEPGARFFSSCRNNFALVTPDPVTMQLGSECLSQIHEQFRFQLVEMWFNVHPLSMIVSKTLFLRSYKDGQHDEALLAVIMAGAKHAYRGGADVELQLFDYAEALLNERSNQSWDLTTAQVVLLIGWHELLVRRTHKAAYLIGYAGRIAGFLQQANKDVPKGRANGVDIDRVEAELIRNIYWVTFAMSLWAFMEVGEPFSALLPKRLPPAFPAVDETQSAIIELDLASDNVSTFQSQARTIRGLWPLAHIASTVGHIYALYPKDQSRTQTPADLPWQLKPLHQLRGLLRLDEGRKSLSQSVQKVLKDAVDAVEREVRNEVSRAMVTAAYLVLIIHLEFPKIDENVTDTSLAVTPQIMERFYQSAETLAQIIKRVVYSRTSTWLLSTTPMNSSAAMPLVETFSSGLEIIGHIATHLVSLLEGSDDTQRQAVLPYLSQIGDLVHGLYLSAKEDLLRSSRKSRSAKKVLKAVQFRIADLEFQFGFAKEPRHMAARHKSTASISEFSDISSWNDSVSVNARTPPSNQQKSLPAARTEVLSVSNQHHANHAALTSIASKAFDPTTIEQHMQMWSANLDNFVDSTGQESEMSWHTIVSDAKEQQRQAHRAESISTEYWDFPLLEHTAITVKGASEAPEQEGAGALLPPNGTSMGFFDDIQMLQASDEMIMTDAAWEEAFAIPWEQATA